MTTTSNTPSKSATFRPTPMLTKVASISGVSSVSSFLHPQTVKWFGITSLGFISGASGVVSIYAIDTVKTKLQASRRAISVPQMVMDTLRKDGFLALYRGLSVSALLTSPEKALKLFLNDWYREKAKSYTKKRNPSWTVEMTAGAFAGFGQLVLTNPLELIKTQMQLEQKDFRLRQVVKKLGVRGLYRGSTGCLLRDIPFSMMYFPLFHKLKLWWSTRDNRTTPLNSLERFSIATLCGTIGAVVVTPCDCIKTRMQSPDPQFQKMSLRQVALHIYRHEPDAFWRGVGLRGLSRGLQFGTTLLTFELLQQVFYGFVESEH